MGRILNLALLGAAAACGRGEEDGRAGLGQIAVQWTGTDSGRMTASATARWCAMDTLLEVVAVQGDSAFGLVLIALDSVRAAEYPVKDSRAFIPNRPQARVALRLLKQYELEGYDALGGQVTVTQGGSREVSGRLDVRLLPIVGADTLRLVGTFDRIPVAPAVGVCGRANKSGPG